MKKIYFLLFAAFMFALNASASVTVCDVEPDENGHFDCPFIKSGSITWNETSHTLTLDNAVVEYSSESAYDYVYPIRTTEDATIDIHGECKLTTTGFVAIGFEGTNIKNVTIQGDGNLDLTSTWHGIYLRFTRLTIKDITLKTDNRIANNGSGEFCKLTFNNVNADITGGIERIGEGIIFRNCAITYPSNAYIAHDQYEDTDYGYFIANGDGSAADHIIISRTSNVPGDVNGDSEVNIADINAVIKVILGGESNPDADVNNDSEVNIADVNAVINIILNPVVIEVHEYVDLGLPSGTLWATCNIGASSPEEYGDYFAWAETTSKSTFSWTTYRYNATNQHYMSKYCTNYNLGPNGFTDYLTELEPEDDAAYVNWGRKWRIPTKTQFSELINSNYTTTTWTTQNGVYGRLITSKSNGNSLFLPAAGARGDSSLGSAGSDGYYWSRMLYANSPQSAYGLSFNSANVKLNHDGRYYGKSVRPVRESNN
jgi:hypothetical protein